MCVVVWSQVKMSSTDDNIRLHSVFWHTTCSHRQLHKISRLVCFWLRTLHEKACILVKLHDLVNVNARSESLPSSRFCNVYFYSSVKCEHIKWTLPSTQSCIYARKLSEASRHLSGHVCDVICTSAKEVVFCWHWPVYLFLCLCLLAEISQNVFYAF